MGFAHSIIDELIVGSPLHIQRTIRISTVYGLVEKCWITVKENTTQTDPQALIKKTITTTATASGQITNAGNSGSAEFVFHLVRADTIKFKPRKSYLVDIWMKQANDEPAGVESGIIITQHAVTLDPS